LLFESSGLAGWDSRFVAFILNCAELCRILTMINFLVGLILAFVGAIELMRFGASIYVADLVGIATLREIGCLMTGIILVRRKNCKDSKS